MKYGIFEHVNLINKADYDEINSPRELLKADLVSCSSESILKIFKHESFLKAFQKINLSNLV